VFEAAVARRMCAHLGVGVQFSAPYAHHMLGKVISTARVIVPYTRELDMQISRFKAISP
jgi:hypothetical protein